MKTLYLDHAAATPMDPRVVAAMRPYLSDNFYNPSALYLAAQKVSKGLEEARRTVAHYLGSRPVEVTFTAGGTEANNLAIHGVMRTYPGSKIIISAIEHDSVLMPASNYSHATAPVTEQGIVDIEALERLIDDETVLVSVMQANNEIGSVQPIHEIGLMLQTLRDDRRSRGVELPLYFHTDASQATNYLDIHVARLGVDMMTLGGGKIYGPKQSGVLYVRAGIRLTPLLDGGGQERNLRSGTENVAADIGFAEALKITQDMRAEETRRLQAVQQYFFDRLSDTIPEVIINGSLKKRLPNNVHVTIPGKDNERLIMELDEAGIMAAAGSACSASSEKPSHVLLAIGLSDEAARSSLRFTLGRSTTQADIDYVMTQLASVLV